MFAMITTLTALLPLIEQAIADEPALEKEVRALIATIHDIRSKYVAPAAS